MSLGAADRYSPEGSSGDKAVNKGNHNQLKKESGMKKLNSHVATRYNNR